jgi:hypothetical protein
MSDWTDLVAEIEAIAGHIDDVQLYCGALSSGCEFQLNGVATDVTETIKLIEKKDIVIKNKGGAAITIPVELGTYGYPKDR